MATVGWVKDEELNYCAIVIRDEASGDTIEVKRSLETDAQDAELGMDTYCVIRGGAIHYGGLEAFRNLSRAVRQLLVIAL